MDALFGHESKCHNADLCLQHVIDKQLLSGFSMTSFKDVNGISNNWFLGASRVFRKRFSTSASEQFLAGIASAAVAGTLCLEDMMGIVFGAH
jgi:hypothetical protein